MGININERFSWNLGKTLEVFKICLDKVLSKLV